MYKILFNVFISEGVRSMPKISKNQWITVGVAVVIVLGLMWAMNNVDAVEDLAEDMGIKD